MNNHYTIKAHKTILILEMLRVRERKQHWFCVQISAVLLGAPKQLLSNRNIKS